ncbi:MAG: FKBP-type peptidyl-prolyl cis-trans isomerase [Granulosicoccus sp.]
MILRYLPLLFCVLLASCSSGSGMQAEPEPMPVFMDDQAVFLAANTARQTVTVTETGLQYEVLTRGDGVRPTAQSNITVHYVGTLVDGTEFDSSVARGQPATFKLGGTIAGWIEGLQLMNVGSTYRFVIPPELAYGDSGAGSFIGPGDALIFVVELLEINS